MSNTSRFLIIILTIAFALLSLTTIGATPNEAGKHSIPPIALANKALSTPQNVAPFTLTDTKKKPFTLSNLKGQWTLLYFGYTRCTHKCPVSFSAIKTMYNNLIAEQYPTSLIPQVMFISLDPDRDSFSDIKHFVTHYNKNFSGAKGDLTQLHQLSDQLRVKFKIVNGNNNNYQIQHTGDIIAINPKGQVEAYITYPQKGDSLTYDYQYIVHSYATSA